MLLVALGFRCLFRADSVGEELENISERLPNLPNVLFYEVSCRLDKNMVCRVRPMLHAHNVRCILDLPQSITHRCSPIYKPEDGLGATAGVSTQAAEVSHSIAVANRTSLAYMAPERYKVHNVVQVAMTNVRKLHRMPQESTSAENDRIYQSPFYHSRLSRWCLRGVACTCQSTDADGGQRDSAPSTIAKATGTTLETCRSHGRFATHCRLESE